MGFDYYCLRLCHAPKFEFVIVYGWWVVYVSSSLKGLTL